MVQANMRLNFTGIEYQPKEDNTTRDYSIVPLTTEGGRIYTN